MINMGNYVKHVGGSVEGKYKQPYDAMVYKDADSGYTIAVDGDGNVIKKVLSSANTDDVVLQAAINNLGARPYTNVLYICSDLTISSTITATKNIDFIGIGNPTITRSIAAGSSWFFYLTGSIVTQDLGSDANAGDRYVVSSDPSIFDVGYLFKIYDDTIFNPADWPTAKTSELHYISKISGNNLYFDDVLLHQYQVLNNGQITRIYPSTYGFYGINFVGPSATEQHRGIILFYTSHSKIVDCSFSNLGESAIVLMNSYSTSILNCKIYNSNMEGLGYGISIADTSAYTRINNNDISACRHAITQGGSSGQPRDTLISDNVIYASEGISSVIDAHGIVESMYINNNMIYSASTTYAIITGAKNTVIRDNVIYGNVCNTRNRITGIDILIEGNYIMEDSVLYTDEGFDSAGETQRVIIRDNVCAYGKTASIGTTAQTVSIIIKNNYGYTTESAGTAATITAGNTYVDVTHSLAATPTKVRVTPNTNLGTRAFWVSDKGASTFRININSSDSIDHTFDWEAQV